MSKFAFMAGRPVKAKPSPPTPIAFVDAAGNLLWTGNQKPDRPPEPGDIETKPDGGRYRIITVRKSETSGFWRAVVAREAHSPWAWGDG